MTNLVQIELQDNQVIKPSANNAEIGSVKFVLDTFEINPNNPMATNRVHRQAFMFGDITALKARLTAFGMIDADGNPIPEGLKDFTIIKTKSYVKFDKNSEPAFCPFPDHKDYKNLMTDEYGSNYFLRYTLEPKYTFIGKERVLRDTTVDLSTEQDIVNFELSDFPRLVQLAAELPERTAEQLAAMNKRYASEQTA